MSIRTAPFSWKNASLSNEVHIRLQNSRSIWVYWRLNNHTKALVARHLEKDWSQVPLIMSAYLWHNDQFRLQPESTPALDTADCVISTGVLSTARRTFLGGLEPDHLCLAVVSIIADDGTWIPLSCSTPLWLPRERPVAWGRPLVPLLDVVPCGDAKKVCTQAPAVRESFRPRLNVLHKEGVIR